MRITILHTICIMSLSALLFSGLTAWAQGSNMEASAGCADASCMFRGLAQNEGAAHLQHINLFSADGKDPRVALDRAAEAARALAPIAMIENSNPVPTKTGQSAKTKATAFMVSPCFALTNRHAVFGADKSANPAGDRSVVFNIGSADAGGFKYELKGTPVRWGNGSTDGQDFVLLQLNKCAGKKTGWMELELRRWDNVANLEVAMAGYPADRSSSEISLQRSCTIKKFKGQSEAYLHDCSSRPGASGSPIFVVENGHPKVIGFHAGADTDIDGVLKEYSEANANSAVPLDFLEAYPEVKRLIEKDIETFGQPNPALTPAQSPAKSLAA